MHFCEVKNCSSSSDSKDLFTSPQDEKLLKLWQNAVGTESVEFYVCQRHFAKRDLLIETNILYGAIPALNLPNQSIKLENNCCGVCLEDLDVGQLVSPEYRDLFKEISDYEPLTDFICLDCKYALVTYKKFQTEIKQKHHDIRNAVKLEELDDSDDCMIVDEEEEVETNMLFCKYCPKFQTNDDKYLIEHIKDKHSFQCDKCSFFCSSAKLLETHIINSHKKGENLQCKFCGLNGFLNKAMLDLHEERIHFVTEFGCLYCEKKSTSASDLRVHVAHAHSYTNRMTLKIKKMTKIVPKHPRQPIITTRVKTSSVPNVPRVKPSHKLTLSSALQKTVTKRPTLVSQAKSEDPLHIFENVQVKEEKNYETPEKQSTVQKDVGYKTKKNSSSIVIKGDVDDIFVEQMPEIIEKTTDKPNLVKASVPNFWSGYDDDKESSSATDLVECLDCHKQMTVEALFLHRLGEHPSLEKDDSLYERIPILPLPLRHKTQDVRHSTLLVACEFCFLEVFEKNLEKHILQCHSDSAKLFLCHVCSKEFTTECRLKYHLTSHDPDKMLTCDICDMKYTMKNRLRRHIERIHLGILIYKAECKICEQKLAQREKLEKHMRKYHTDGFDCGARANSETNFFDCYQCGASYVDLYTYRRHDCEKGRFQIRCNECLKPVKNLESLKIHQANNCLKKMVVKNKVLCYRPY